MRYLYTFVTELCKHETDDKCYGQLQSRRPDATAITFMLGRNVITAACTFNSAGQAQGMPWARCDRPGVNVIAPA